MFQKVLIANRGEIARRIIRTCKRLGIQTVAIYSKADETSLHVREADESYCVGEPPVNQSYLNVDAILAAAKESGAEAIHPGYGLLSENAGFAKRVEQEGLVFIGPTSEVIEAMGSKLEARKRMASAGVPIIEGVNEAMASATEASDVAAKIGYPVMLKASAGGGGIGMQVVHDEAELLKAFEGNQKRAESFFGDGTMFVEKFIAEPHHIEVQVLADQHGHTIPVFERECSVQRRNQKVVEEATSPFISAETREKMLDAAVAAASSIGYTNAGTIEFLVDANEQFYFLEMNTRLQVEHPVTEEISGLDLVEWQLKIASGEELTIERSQLTIHGHAIEVRIYAEDPVRFFPSPGTITKLVLPQGAGIRHEAGVEEGSVVTPFYDPMIAKLITTGTTRDEAVTRMQQALADYVVEGIKTNIPMLRDVVAHPEFKAGRTTTKFVEQYYLPEVAKK
ncbi:acetyl/propionyl/methylcrotonyl-CoA carboxylase subunit alpha [Kurthia sp. Dielmo]|uniref:acetyl-CoA carboxylase biotin carboxylase subunit n=1 Tax=Kurthia sp. Dielmo TaxID=1033738 RepID=UPI00112409FB|nr:acetyl-CoA carboxylase biotin carboxylase subunit [Kurthia sp. Dielmo]